MKNAYFATVSETRDDVVMTTPKKQMDLKQQLDGQRHTQKVADDFLASFLQAGIPVDKLSHPSIAGLFAQPHHDLGLATKPCISHSELTPKMTSNFRKVTPLGRYGTFWKHE